MSEKVCERGKCRIPAAGIFPLSDTSGVLVSTVQASDEKVSMFLHEKYGDKFRIRASEVRCSAVPDGYIWLYWFEVLNDG